jgi:hypothetical protein
MTLRRLTAARDAKRKDAGKELVTVVPARASHPAPS